ncbi:MAG TPA: nicotinate-nucleotide adenylyltransferase [Streptosporangiaceae bacterium]|nr:nicotinate-nucleotide adenylyltransferase [Streptosporangiaceae bacterium]
MNGRVRGSRIGVMGGTFDPVHHGHLVAANEAAQVLRLDEVIFVPTGQPWQKGDRALAPAEDRYLMTVLATASHPRFSVSRVEIDRPGLTYTVDTLRDLRAELGPDVEFFFVLGADALSGFATWRSPERLLEMAHFVGCTRPGHRLAGEGMADGRFKLIEIPALEISSSECRERVRLGRSIRYLVPDEVMEYISKRGLYRDADGAGERPAG